jgi:Domain of unknown function (DUF6250)
MKKKSCAIVFLLLFVAVHAQVSGRREENQHQTKNELSYKRGKLLYKDDFDNGFKNWVVEIPSRPGSTITVKEKKMLSGVDGGATIWLNKKLSGNLIITYNRKVIVDTGRNDRLSDLNQFWMAIDPRNENLFTRSGISSEYDSLLLYYAGFGGNSNTTMRF